MIGAAEFSLATRGLFDQLRATMGADIVESADLLVPAPNNQQRRTGEFEIVANEATSIRQFADMADMNPAFQEDGFALQLEIGRIIIGLGRNRIGAQPR